MKVARCIASVVLAAASMAALGCGQSPQERTVLVYAFDIPAGQEGKPDIDKAVAVIDRRINPVWSWNKTARIRRVSEMALEVRLRTADPAAVMRIDRLLTALGSLEFRVLANDHDSRGIIEEAKTLKPDVNKLYSTSGKLEAWWVPVDPPSKEKFNYREIARRTVTKNGQQVLQILVVNDPFNVTGSYLTRVRSDVDEKGRPDVTFQLNSAGGRKFGGLTATHLPDEVTGFTRKLGIIFDGHLHSAPSIQSTIQDRGEITGSFTKRDTEDLASVLNAGELPAPLKKVSQRTEKP
jgi:SecD/SecF fusion protein